jgi:hypothetical protein
MTLHAVAGPACLLAARVPVNYSSEDLRGAVALEGNLPPR